MYPEFLMAAHGETQADREMVSIKESERLSTLTEVEETSAFRERIQTNQKFLGDQLLPASRQRNQQIKYQAKDKGIEVVIISPEIASLQTCLDFFGESEGVEIHVEPLLHPRINSASNIPGNIDDLLSKFRTQPYIAKIQDKNWFFSYGREGSSVVDENRNPQDHCFEMLRKYGGFESLNQYLQRNVNLRKELFDYVEKTKKKVAIITHPQVLEALTATGWHQDGKLVNAVSFEFGDVKSEHIWIEGVQAEAEESNLPICGM